VPSTSAAAPRLSDEQLSELLSLAPDVDSVELKLTIQEGEHLAVAAALGMDPLDAHIRQVYFFDTPALALDEQGVVVRARRVQGRDGDSVVKLRPVVPSELPKSLRARDDFSLEVDALPGQFVCSGTLKRSRGNPDIRAVVAGQSPLSGLFSKHQRELVSEHGPDGIDLDDLSVLGPILVLKLKFEPEGLERRITAELWLYPDGSRVLELSTKSKPRDAFLAAAEMRAYVAQRGIDLAGHQEAKTRKALEFFAKGPPC
jgi:hypothetical protein